LKYNNTVMASDGVIDFLASRIAANLPLLGKTLVFVPNISAANRMVAALVEPLGRGQVSMVHTRLDEFNDEGDDGSDIDATDVFSQINAFKKRGSEPCVMVNVGMLTTGFDDPKIRTVVLARLTFSQNLYWQMIGRGTRGPRTGGTEDVIVIDPVRLTDHHGLTEYVPAVGRASPEPPVKGALDPSVRAVYRPPSARRCPPRVSGSVRREVSAALANFVRGASLTLDPSMALAVAVSTTMAADGTVEQEIVPATAANRETIAAFVPAITIDNLEAELRKRSPDADLAWLRGPDILPTIISPASLEAFNRKVERILTKKLVSYEQYLEEDARRWQ
jgi:hypothetical protein